MFTASIVIAIEQVNGQNTGFFFFLLRAAEAVYYITVSGGGGGGGGWNCTVCQGPSYQVPPAADSYPCACSYVDTGGLYKIHGKSHHADEWPVQLTHNKSSVQVHRWV